LSFNVIQFIPSRRVMGKATRIGKNTDDGRVCGIGKEARCDVVFDI